MDKKLNLSLNIEELNKVLFGLGKLPFEAVYELIKDIQNQVQNQMQNQIETKQE